MHACLAEIRRAGSYSSRASRRSSPSSSRPGTSARDSERLHLGNVGLKSGKDVTPGQVSSSGVPRSLQTRRRKVSLPVSRRATTERTLPEDLENLVNLGVTGKQGFASAHLSEDCTDCPHVDTSGVLTSAK